MKKFALILLLCALSASALGVTALAAEPHYMGDWHFDKIAGRHWAQCVFDDEFVMFQDCSVFECVFEGKTLSVCPVCGHNKLFDGTSVRCSAYVYDYSNSPTGDLLVIKYDRPFGDDSEILAAYSVVFEYAGGIVDFDGSIALSLPVSNDNCVLFRADGEEVHEIDFKYDQTINALEFAVTGGQGLFLLKQK